jgi:hypothetical protein
MGTKPERRRSRKTHGPVRVPAAVFWQQIWPGSLTPLFRRHPDVNAGGPPRGTSRQKRIEFSKAAQSDPKLLSLSTERIEGRSSGTMVVSVFGEGSDDSELGESRSC